MKPPNKEYAGIVCDRLGRALFDARAELAGRDDPEGRALSLGVTMFMGMFMSAITNMDDRMQLCEAAIGYSLQADDLIRPTAEACPAE
jgi:hypothetical protein